MGQSASFIPAPSPWALSGQESINIKSSMNRSMILACCGLHAEDGWCWWYRKYAPGDIELEKLEKDVRESKKGLWVDPAPIPPWVYRKAKRTKHRRAYLELEEIKRLRSRKDRVNAVRLQLMPFFGGKHLTAITAQDVKAIVLNGRSATDRLRVCRQSTMITSS
jgi:hypothetical protein